MFKFVLTVITAYLIGSILTGVIVGHLKQVNLRSQGSGNVGATNVFRNMGSLFGAIVLIGDVLKGIIAVWLGRRLGMAFGLELSLVAGLFAVIGHNWSVFANFKGGKGIATSLGVIIAINPVALLVVIPVWIILFVAFGYVSLASVTAAISYPVATVWFSSGDRLLIVIAIIIGGLAVYRHRINLVRLVKGEEHRILYKNRRSQQK